MSVQTLTAVRTHTPAPMTQTRAREAAMQSDIVLVDDDPLVIRALTRLFARAGLPVWASTDPVKALERIERAPPIAIVADHQMPGITGLDLLTRSRVVAPHSRRILITGNATIAVLTDAINKSHIHSFFPKPVQGPELVQALVQVFDSVRDRQRAAEVAQTPVTERPKEVEGDELLGAALGAASALGLNLRGR
jgi:DNA-binding NtrC family response regulator